MCLVNKMRLVLFVLSLFVLSVFTITIVRIFDNKNKIIKIIKKMVDGFVIL